MLDLVWAGDMNKVLSDDIILYFNKKLENGSINYADVFKLLKKDFKAIQVALLCNYILISYA